ncbi:MAG TPA: amidohydrolase family protein [Planctomycetota bacterium]|nr:amidohydrolase family protein [Planctomycetota bacterium]
MWIRRCEVDAELEAPLPIPTQIASNEEFIPPPQSAEQKEVEARTLEMAADEARRHGLSRRAFLRTGSGMAAALLAMNQVFGRAFAVDEAEVKDQDAYREKWPKEQFIFDIQTHHVDVEGKWYENTPDGQVAGRFFRSLRPGAKDLKAALDLMNRDHYVKEVFLDSDTVMSVISGVPSSNWEKNPLPPDQMVATRKHVNDLAGSQRVLSHGLIRPNLGERELDEMERQVKELKVDAWKMYTGAEIGRNAWWLDDEKVAYPFWERTLKLGVKNVCVHKGLPLGIFNEEHCKPRDVIKAAKDWPLLNFIIYHSGFRGFEPLRANEKKSDDPQEIPWISDLLRGLKSNPEVRNVYFELGSTFGQTSAYAPRVCMHMLGQMLQVPGGEERILWGTDSIWGGSPQSQIVRMRRLEIADDLAEKYKYPRLTDGVKDRIFGLNAAKLFGVDPLAARKAIQKDKLMGMKFEYDDHPEPSNTQYGWIWGGGGKRPALPFRA